MSDIMPISSDFFDKNNKSINLGSAILYKGNHYIVLSSNKDDNMWIAHPCGGNMEVVDLNLAEICNESELI